MKVVQINCLAETGSTGRIVRQLAEALTQNGDACGIAYSSGSSSWPDSFRYTNEPERKVHALLSRVTGYQGYFTQWGTTRLLRWLDAEKPDVVHLHNLHDNNINRPALFQYLIQKRIPVMITLHDCNNFTGRCVYYSLQGCYQWTTHCEHCPVKHEDIPTWFFDRCASMFDDKKRDFSALSALGVVGVSDWITHEAQRSVLLRPARFIKRIYNWVNFDVFHPMGTAVGDVLPQFAGKHIFLSIVAQWRSYKGLHDCLALSPLLAADEQIVLVGEMVEKVDLPQNIVSLGTIHDDRRLACLYSAADVLMNFSRQETFGLVTAEALACGTPAVVRASTANPELIGPGCGEVVEAEAPPAAFYAAVRRVRAAGKAALGPQCTAFAQTHFNKETNTAAYVALYHALAEGREQHAQTFL